MTTPENDDQSHFALTDVLDVDQVQQCWDIYDACAANNELPHKQLLAYLEPHMEQVNQKLPGEQQLTAGYLAYAAEYVFSMVSRRE